LPGIRGFTGRVPEPADPGVALTWPSIQLDRSSWLPAFPQERRCSPVTGLQPARASLSPHLAKGSATPPLSSQLKRSTESERCRCILGLVLSGQLPRQGDFFKSANSCDAKPLGERSIPKKAFGRYWEGYDSPCGTMRLHRSGLGRCDRRDRPKHR
jgi:hypothetical protein